MTCSRVIQFSAPGERGLKSSPFGDGMSAFADCQCRFVATDPTSGAVGGGRHRAFTSRRIHSDGHRSRTECPWACASKREASRACSSRGERYGVSAFSLQTYTVAYTVTLYTDPIVAPG